MLGKAYFCDRSVLLVRDLEKMRLDKVSRALYAVPPCAEKVYEKIYGRQYVCCPYIFELTVSAYIITKSPGVKMSILINANIAATTTWWST